MFRRLSVESSSRWMGPSGGRSWSETSTLQRLVCPEILMIAFVRSSICASTTRTNHVWAEHDQISNWIKQEWVNERNSQINRWANNERANDQTRKQVNEQMSEHTKERTQNERANEQADTPDHALSKEGQIRPLQIWRHRVPTLAIEASKLAIPPIGCGCRRSKAFVLWFHAMTRFEGAIGEWANLWMSKFKNARK